MWISPRVFTAVNHTMVTKPIAVAGFEITKFKSVNGDSIAHRGDPSDQERTGFVGADRITQDPAEVGIEELHLAHEGLTLLSPEGA